MADYPPIDRSYVVSYAANDRDYPVIGIKRDPRTAGYRVPEDLSPHPDSKRYPNHVFTGAQPASGDQIVTHIYEILPAPWVPFTRYDDDLGPIQGRRRAVKNEGQQADLTTEKKISYEGRDGSAIVSNEIEETWSIKTDEDGNSLFPIKDRDFYDASRGAVQERRQLFVPTGEEEGALENVNGVITQTSYEPYNEFLSVKIVQTYKVDGPQLVGKATNNEGQLVTVTTQRKAALNYVPPNPTATRTVEVSRDDAESLVERVVDTPEVFNGKSIQKTKVDLTPEKFRAAQEDTTTEETIAGAINLNIALGTGEFSKSEQQVTQFVKRVSTNTRDVSASTDLAETVITPQGQVAIRTLRLSAETQSIQPDALLIDGSIEALGDGRTIKTEVRVPDVFDAKTLTVTKPDTIPEKFRVNAPINRTEEIVEQEEAQQPVLSETEYSKTEQRTTNFTVQKSVVEREDIFNEVQSQRLEENWGINIPFREYISTSIPNSSTVEGEGLGDIHHLVREYDSSQLNATLSAFSVTMPTSIDLDLPRVLKDVSVLFETQKSSLVSELDTTGGSGGFKSLTQQDDGSVSSTLSIVPKIEVEFEDIWGKNLPATLHLFFLKKESLTSSAIRSKVGASANWPVFKPKSFITTVFGKTEKKEIRAYISRALQVNNTPIGYGYLPTKGNTEESLVSLNPISINIPPCLTEGISVNASETLEADSETIRLNYETITTTTDGGSTIVHPEVNIEIPLEHELEVNVNFSIPRTSPNNIPRSGKYLISSSAEPYKFGWFLVRATSFDASILS